MFEVAQESRVSGLTLNNNQLGKRKSISIVERISSMSRSATPRPLPHCPGLWTARAM